MKAFLFTAVILLSALPAFAAEVALMVNLNYSVGEWQRFKASAEKCGRTAISIPSEEFLPYGEAVFRKRDELDAKIRRLRPKLQKNDREAMLAEIMRDGNKWNRDPEIAQQYSGLIQEVHLRAKALDDLEKQQGSISEQLRSVAEQLVGHKVASVAFSAHSDGWNLTGESANRLSGGDLEALTAEYPGLFQDTLHVLLLGCYNMTGINRPHWRSLFPYASLMGGFGRKAPARTQPAALDFITDNLDLACALDQNIAATGRNLNPRTVESYFKSLASITGTNSVVDYCYQIIEGQPGSDTLTCDEQWTTFLAQAEAVQKSYMDLRDLKKDPPFADGPTSELRLFYEALQSTCPAKDAPQLSDEIEASENYRASIRESTIRLIFWWRVQRNFKTYYSRELAELEQSIKNAGLNAALTPLDGKTGRVEFVKSYNAIRDGISARRRQLNALRIKRLSPSEAQSLSEAQNALADLEKRFKVLSPLFALQGELTVGVGMTTGPEATLARGAIPFNWIEGTVLKPRSR
jgi:hypothetical protein